MPDTESKRDAAWSQTVALRIIAGLLLVGTAWVLATILVPFVLAVVLAVTLSPIADRLERFGMPRAVSSLFCMLAVAGLLAVAAGLATYEAETILRDRDKYVSRFGTLLDHVIDKADAGRESRETSSHDQSHTSEPSASPERANGELTSAPKTDEDDRASTARRTSPEARQGKGVALIHRSVDSLGSWVATGVGGVLGVIGGTVVFLAFLFYTLYGRDEWIDSIATASRRLGMKPARGELEKVRDQMVRYVSVLAMVACVYVVVVSTALWLIGVPEPILWGLLAGMFEVVPYFGPLIASVMPTVVSLSLNSWWQPVATAGLFLVLHTIEGYVITPMLYGKAVKFDPVTILFGALFFGALWGPVGLAVATPMLIVFRGLLMISPDTPALDALANVKDEKDEKAAAPPVESARNLASP